MRLALPNYINRTHSLLTAAETTQFCDWWVDSPHSFGDLVVMQGRRVFPRCTEAEGALGGDGGRTYDDCDGDTNL